MGLQQSSQERSQVTPKEPHFLMLTHFLQQHHLYEQPWVGALQELLAFHRNLSADCSGRVQRSEALQSLTWKGYEFLKLLFQPADFLTKLNVIHPAETQMKPLRERPGEERFNTSRATPSQHWKATHLVPVAESTDLPAFISELWLELHGLCHWLLAKEKVHHFNDNETSLKPGTSMMQQQLYWSFSQKIIPKQQSPKPNGSCCHIKRADIFILPFCRIKKR